MNSRKPLLRFGYDTLYWETMRKIVRKWPREKRHTDGELLHDIWMFAVNPDSVHEAIKASKGTRFKSSNLPYLGSHTVPCRRNWPKSLKRFAEFYATHPEFVLETMITLRKRCSQISPVEKLLRTRPDITNNKAISCKTIAELLKQWTGKTFEHGTIQQARNRMRLQDEQLPGEIRKLRNGLPVKMTSILY